MTGTLLFEKKEGLPADTACFALAPPTILAEAERRRGLMSL
jgi:hypothetical protein